MSTTTQVFEMIKIIKDIIKSHIQKENETSLRKKVSIEYIAFNPQHKDNPITMDISFSNSLRFEQDVNVDNAKKLFDVRVTGGQVPCHGGTSTLDTLNQTAA